jgi:plastocyanin
MKKLILLAGAVALLVAAPAPAKTVTVDIKHTGFAPGAVTVAAGDIITWTNKDTVNHQVVCATCPFTSAVLTPGQTASFTFTKVGKFTVVDPLNKNKKGTVTVTPAPPSLSITANAHVLNYGASAMLSGGLSTGQTAQKVDVLAQPCGENAAKVIGTATTTAGGTWALQPQITMTTIYTARYKAAGGATITSPALTVSVRPIVTLTRVARGRFGVAVYAAQSFVGKAVVFQRWIAAKHRWRTVKTVFLATKATSPTATTVSSVTFSVKVRSRSKVRVVLPPGQASPCYLAASSKTIRS